MGRWEVSVDSDQITFQDSGKIDRIDKIIMAVEMNLILIDRGKRSLVLMIVIASRLIASGEEIPTIVNRRLSGDTYQFLSSNEVIHTCSDNNLTFLVDDIRCVNNQGLLNGNPYCCNINISIITKSLS